MLIQALACWKNLGIMLHPLVPPFTRYINAVGDWGMLVTALFYLTRASIHNGLIGPLSLSLCIGGQQRLGYQALKMKYLKSIGKMLVRNITRLRI